MTQIYVVDSIMGSGKTSAAINKMNEDTETNYIFITPFLSEVDRIKEKCTARTFYEPENKGDGKLDNLHSLLKRQLNIASTHALFKGYNEDTKEWLRLGNYTLILDEVFNVLEPYNISKDDMNMLLNNKIIHLDENKYVIWDKQDYDGEFKKLKKLAETKNLVYINEFLFFWVFPHSIFESFKEVYILTYMFDAQLQKYYYDMNGLAFEYLYVDKNFHFSDKGYIPAYVRQLKDKIHILDHDKLNSIGDNPNNLSVTWFDKESSKKNRPFIKLLKNNIYNVYNNQFKSLVNSFNMWTTYKEYQPLLSGKGYKNAFVSVNSRSTNEHKERKYLAYCANIFLNPHIKKYFEERGVRVLEEKYALSELLQWIWRSAIREGNEIWIYIPSIRMRGLLSQFLDHLTNNMV